MKKFEEEFDKNVDVFHAIGYHNGICCSVEEAKTFGHGWVSPEDYEKYIKESTDNTSKLLGKINELKSQLEKQQPEIPEFVAEVFGNNDVFLTAEKMDIISWFNDRNSDRAWDKVTLWARENEEQFIQYVLNFKPVAKEKRFYLKHELTGQFLAKRNQKSEHQKYFFWTGENPLTHSIGTAWELKFTQSEIDSMETGSYEQIELVE